MAIDMILVRVCGFSFLEVAHSLAVHAVDIANYSVVDSKLDLALDIHQHTLAAAEGDTGSEELDSLDCCYTPFRINAPVDATDQ